MPTLQQMRYLVALADMKHFRRAAEVAHVTQPTLSMQLKELELRLGAQLVERSRSRVMLTPVGREIAARARRILSEVEDIREIARGSHHALGGTMRVGVVQSLGSYLLPHIVHDLHDTHPDLRLYVREGLPDALLSGLEEGTLDFLFYPLPLTRRDLVQRPLFIEPLLVVLPRDHALAAKPAVEPADLAGETILALEPGHRLYEQVRALADLYEAEVSHDFEGTSLDTLRQMVAMGMGISLLPALYVRSEVTREDLVVARPIRGTPPSRDIGMIWRRSSARDEELRELAGIVSAIMVRDVPEILSCEAVQG